MPPKKNAAPKNQLAGKTIVFTGTLTMSRSEATSQAEACGAKVGSAVSGNTDFLVAGAGNKSSKSSNIVIFEYRGWTEDRRCCCERCHRLDRGRFQSCTSAGIDYIHLKANNYN